MEGPVKVLRGIGNVRRGPSTVIEHEGNGAVGTQMSPCATGNNTNTRRLGPPFG